MGVSQCYANYSVPFGTVDFTADVLQIKSAACNGLLGSFVDASDIGLAESLKNAGVSVKQVYETGYDSTLLADPSAVRAFQGAYVQTPINFATPNAATETMLTTLAKYDPSFKKGDIPDLGSYGSYISADLMIKGLEGAGKNPTRAAFISNLRKVGSWNAEGILAQTVSFRHVGGVAMLPTPPCSYFVQLKGNHFVTANGGKPVCGKNVGVPGLS